MSSFSELLEYLGCEWFELVSGVSVIEGLDRVAQVSSRSN